MILGRDHHHHQYYFIFVVRPEGLLECWHFYKNSTHFAEIVASLCQATPRVLFMSGVLHLRVTLIFS